MGARSFSHTEGGAKCFHTLKGEAQQVLSCLEGGAKGFGPAIFPLYPYQTEHITYILSSLSSQSIIIVIALIHNQFYVVRFRLRCLSIWSENDIDTTLLLDDAMYFGFIAKGIFLSMTLLSHIL